jgi:hypothetical protein
MSITSLSREQPRPNLPHYALSLLELFRRWTRQSWEEEFGSQPEPFDPDQPKKDWFDTSENAGNYTRLQGQDSLAARPTFTEMKMTRDLAAKVNLPGAYRYSPYVPPLTQAITELLNDHGDIVAKLPVNARDLTTEAQAAAIATEVGGVVEADTGWVASSTRWPADELRRVWHVRVGDASYTAGWLVQMKNANGVGAPGTWVKDAQSLRWAPKPQITDHLDDKVKPVPAPVRRLDPDEDFGRPMPTSGWMVVRITPASGSDALLVQIMAALRQIGQRLGLNL